MVWTHCIMLKMWGVSGRASMQWLLKWGGHLAPGLQSKGFQSWPVYGLGTETTSRKPSHNFSRRYWLFSLSLPSPCFIALCPKSLSIPPCHSVIINLSPAQLPHEELLVIRVTLPFSFSKYSQPILGIVCLKADCQIHALVKEQGNTKYVS